jgi:hypothetical protein
MLRKVQGAGLNLPPTCLFFEPALSTRFSNQYSGFCYRDISNGECVPETMGDYYVFAAFFRAAHRLR